MNASFYNEIKKILISARNKVYQTANFAMVEAYWNIGKSIIEEQGGNEKAERIKLDALSALDASGE